MIVSALSFLKNISIWKIIGGALVVGMMVMIAALSYNKGSKDEKSKVAEKTIERQGNEIKKRKEVSKKRSRAGGSGGIDAELRKHGWVRD